MNREFKGAGFLVTPKEVVFRDFEVGETYRQKITLTNVFWTKNTFKVMEMPPEVRNFFDVEYSFPGLVSAGITCDVYVNFEPKRNEDIATHIPIITQTGPVTVPVRCLRKRATLSLSAPIVYFQKITIGEAKEQQAQIINNGALAVDFKWEVVSIESALKEPPAEQVRGGGGGLGWVHVGTGVVCMYVCMFVCLFVCLTPPKAPDGAQRAHHPPPLTPTHLHSPLTPFRRA